MTSITVTLNDVPDEIAARFAALPASEQESMFLGLLRDRFEDEPLSIAEGSPEEDRAIEEALRDFAEGRFRRFDPEAELRRYGLQP